jgi:hypothetical protein
VKVVVSSPMLVMAGGECRDLGMVLSFFGARQAKRRRSSNTDMCSEIKPSCCWSCGVRTRFTRVKSPGSKEVGMWTEEQKRHET